MYQKKKPAILFNKDDYEKVRQPKVLQHVLENGQAKNLSEPKDLY